MKFLQVKSGSVIYLMEKFCRIYYSNLHMKSFRVKLIKKDVISSETVSFYFEKPAGFRFKAGQYCKITLINPPQTDLKGDTRSFSFACAPDEEFLMITVRLRNSVYKKILNSLPMGSEVIMLAPLTMMSLKGGGKKPLVFICGGIGVAAARSLILDALSQGFSREIYLFNSNRNMKRTVFLSEFNGLQKVYPNFKYIPTVTGESASPLIKEQGYITEEMILRYVPDIFEPLYYIAGPSKFVWGMFKMIKATGVKDDRFSFDEFTGY